MSINYVDDKYRMLFLAAREKRCSSPMLIWGTRPSKRRRDRRKTTAVMAKIGERRFRLARRGTRDEVAHRYNSTISRLHP